MKILNQTVSINTKTFAILLFAILLINACGKDDCDDSIKNLYVDKSYLPYIIPYSDTSTRLFLKNGKDTLLFKSKGLEETTNFYQESDINGLCRKYNMQKLSLTMAASDTDYFKINYYMDKEGTGLVDFNSTNFWKSIDVLDFTMKKNYPPVLTINVLNNKFDTVRIIKTNLIDSVCCKPFIGVIKIKNQFITYELIK